MKVSLSHSTSTDRLQTLEIHHALRTTLIGRTIYLFSCLESTNKTALRLAEQPMPSSEAGQSPAPDGTLILAEAQSQGRGRQGRTWISPPGVNLYASLILRPRLPVPEVPVVTCLAAASIVQTIRACTHLEAVIKWPNDVLIHGKKVAGILTELDTKQDQVQHLVVGMGINVNLDPQTLPGEIRPTATSLKAEAAHNIDRNKLMADICNRLEERYHSLLNEGPTQILKEFCSFTSTLGQRVRVITPGRMIEGLAEDINPCGALILRTDKNILEVIHSGDVVHLRNGE